MSCPRLGSYQSPRRTAIGGDKICGVQQRTKEKTRKWLQVWTPHNRELRGQNIIYGWFTFISRCSCTVSTKLQPASGWLEDWQKLLVLNLVSGRFWCLSPIFALKTDIYSLSLSSFRFCICKWVMGWLQKVSVKCLIQWSKVGSTWHIYEHRTYSFTWRKIFWQDTAPLKVLPSCFLFQ